MKKKKRGEKGILLVLSSAFLKDLVDRSDIIKLRQRRAILP